MHKAIKLAGGLFLALILLTAAVLGYLVLTFDPNDYRNMITQRVEAETGRTLTLDDQLSLQFYPWIGLNLGSASLSGPATFAGKPFVAIRSASIKVKVMPLLQKRLEVDTIVLNGLDVMLSTNAAGENNWDFSKKQASATAVQPRGAGSESTGTESTGTASSGAALAGLLINGVDIENSAIHWRDQKSATQYDLSGLSLKTGAIHTGAPVDIDLATTVSGTSLPQSGLPLHLAARITIADDGKHLNIEALRLQSDSIKVNGDVESTLTATGAQYSGHIEIAPFAAKPLLDQLGISLPAFSDPQVLQQLAVGLTFSGNENRLDIGKLTIQIDKSHLVGQTHLTLAPSFAADFTLALDGIDIDRYLPAATATNTTPGTPPPPAAAAAVATLGLPLDTLRTLDLHGKLTIDNLIVAGLHTSDIATTLAADKGLIRLQPVQASLYQGKTEGSLQLDARGKTPRFSLKQQLQGFQTEPFLKDLLDKAPLSGRADMTVDMDTAGDSVDNLVKQLNGSAQLAFHDGAIKGLNIADEIRRAKAKIENKPVPEKADLQTDFTALAATITVRNGIASNTDLNIQAPYLRVGGNGSADLNKQTIDYHLNAKVVGEAKGQGGEELESLRGTIIPIVVRGPLTAPEIKLDSAVIREQLRKRAQEKVEERVDEKREELKGKIEDKSDELKDKLEDKLKQKLKKLF